MTKETLGRVIAAINRIIDTYPKVAIGFFGGEPLLKYDSIVKPIMEHGTGYANAIGKDISFSFTTNGYLLPEERIKFLRQHNIQSFQITLDGGRKFHDETRNTHNKGSYDTILSNAKSLLGNDLPVTLRFNVTKENINSFTDVVEWISHLPTDNKRNLTVTVHQVWQTIKKEELTDDIDRLIDSIIAQGVYACGVKQDNLRNMCYGDKKNTAIINYNGDIYRCTAVDFKNVPGIGHISPDGCLSEEESHIDRLINSRWEKHICRECRIMPLCLGGCSKKIIDNPPEYCVYDDDEAKKDKVVLDIIKNRVRVMEYNKIIDTFVNV